MTSKRKSKNKDSGLEKAISFFVPSDKEDLDFTSSQFNWYYTSILDYDYENSYNCSEDGCDDEGICRCGKIIDTSLSNLNIIELVKTVTEGIDDKILVYCIDRIIRLQKLNEGCFDLNTCHGYYGDEISSITMHPECEQQIAKNLRKLKDLSDIKKIKFVLTLEYGFVLQDLERTSKVEISEIDFSSITFKDDYSKKLCLSEDYYDEKFELPRGIFVRHCERFRLIDGYHRTFKANSIGMKNIPALILS